jgi:2-polyprenyl-3-methyl-5-hydroxy-6-metoxy-1,4-benzoquinol methylase
MGIRTRPVTQCPVCCGVGRVRHPDLRDRAYNVAGTWEITECTKCASGWLNPVPIPEDLEQCYVGAYYTHERPEIATLGRSQKAELLRRLVLSARKGYTELKPSIPFSSLAGSILARIPSVWSRACYSQEDLIPTFKAGGRLLEIGCGGGGFLSIMQLLGWKVCGVEPDPVAAAVAREIVGCEIHQGTIEDAAFDEERFDAIVTSHVIEHAYDPRSFVARSGRLLAHGGVMTVLTPNFASLGHKMFGTDWYCLDPPRHLCLFTPKSLQNLFTDSGLFRDVRTRTITRASGLAIIRRRAVQTTGNFLGGSGNGARVGDSMFRALEAAGNPFFGWGEEVQCVAVR